MTIQVLPQAFSVLKHAEQLDPRKIPGFCFWAQTDQERSLVCETTAAPENYLVRSDGWRGFRIKGQLDFSLVGVLAQIAAILAREQISLFAVSTFDTDYILVKQEQLQQALDALKCNGYEVKQHEQ